MEKEISNRTTIPVTSIWNNILLLPIVGTIDSSRAQKMMETILKKISYTHSKIIILDFLGVAAVDTAVALHLIKITKATKLIGCETIFTGISPEIAQTMVQLGIELGNVITTAMLNDGLELAFEKLGLEVKKIK